MLAFFHFLQPKNLSLVLFFRFILRKKIHNNVKLWSIGKCNEVVLSKFGIMVPWHYSCVPLAEKHSKLFTF
jgi:hypothetical protein